MVTRDDIKREFYENGLNAQEWTRFRRKLHQLNAADERDWVRLNPLQSLVANQLKLCNRDTMLDTDLL